MIVFIGTIQTGIAQNNVIFAELGGNAQGGSINYERSLSKTSGLTFSLGIGIALVKENENDMDTGADYDLPGIPDPKLSIPFSFQYIFNLKKTRLLRNGIGL